MPHVDPRPWAVDAPSVDSGERAPIFHPHLPPVIRGREVVDVALPEPELMPAAVASGMGGAENGAQRPPPGLAAHEGPGVATAPRTPARGATEPIDPVNPNSIRKEAR